MNIPPEWQRFSDRARQSKTETEFRAKRPGVYEPDPFYFDPRPLPPSIPSAPHRRGRGRWLASFSLIALVFVSWVIVGGAAMALFNLVATFLP